MRENACGNFVFVCLSVFFFLGEGVGTIFADRRKNRKIAKIRTRKNQSCHGTLKCECATVTKLKRYENTRQISCCM